MPAITFEELSEPKLIDDFYGAKTFLHTKVMLNGDWCLSIKCYRGGMAPKKSVIIESDDYDADAEEYSIVVIEPEVVEYGTEQIPKWNEFRVQANEEGWPLLAFNFSGEFAALDEAKAEATKAIHDIIKFFEKKSKVIWCAQQKYRYRFSYGPGKSQTVTVYSFGYEQALRHAKSEMHTRYRVARKVPPDSWELALINTTDPQHIGKELAASGE